MSMYYNTWMIWKQCRLSWTRGLVHNLVSIIPNYEIYNLQKSKDYIDFLACKHLIALEELSFTKCEALKHIPKEFATLTCLKKLYMWECEALKVFPSGLTNLIALEELSFTKCEALKHVLEGFATLTCLKKLYMWECEALEVFPSGLTNLIALEELSFSKCQILSINSNFHPNFSQWLLSHYSFETLQSLFNSWKLKII